MPLQFRRGTDAQRLTITPAAGEPIWTTNTNRLYVGDGTTVGGVAVEVPLPSTGTFTSLTVTNIHFSGDPVGVNQTTAWTGTVAWSAIGSKPNNGLYTTSSVTFSNVTATTQVLVNATGGSTYEPAHSTGYLVWGIESGGPSARIVTDAYSGSSASVSSVWTGRKARGTAAAPTAVQSGDLILRVAGTGFGTTEFASTSSGYLEVVARENFTDGARGTQINLATTNVGTNTPNNSLSVASDGTLITAPLASATESVLTINKTGLTTYPAPVNVDGYDIWAIREGESGRGVIDVYGTAVSPNWQGRRARGTASAPTAVQADDVLLSVRGNGYGTTGYAQTSTGAINFSAIENFTDTARGTRIQFFAAPVGDVSLDLVATMRADGVYVYSTATSGEGMLTISGVGPTTGYESCLDDTLLLGVAKPGDAARITLDSYGSSLPDYTVAGTYSGRRARGTSTTPTAAQNGDVLARLNGFGYGTSGFLNTSSGLINIVANENFTDGAAGGKIQLVVQQNGQNSTATQLLVATFDQTGLQMEGTTGITATSITIDNLVGGSGGNITAYANIAPNGTRNLGSLAAPWSNIYGSTVKTTNLTFADATNQTTAWTGSVSTSSVTGLATVAWTGKYSDLIGGPNQALDTTSLVQFAGITDTGNLSVTGFSSLNGGATLSAATVTNNLTVGANLTAGMTSVGGLAVTTGTVIQKTVTSGGYPLNSAGTASIYTFSGSSPAAVFSNYSGNLLPNILVRGYGQNRPNGTASTAPNINIQIDSAYGTQAAPTAMLSNQNLGGITAQGFDGNNWPTDFGQGYNFLGWYSSEAMTSVGTSTYQAGSGFNIYIQPAWTRPGINATRQRIFFTSNTTATGGPSQVNMILGSGVDATAPTMTMVDGTTYTGYGRTNFALVNSLNNILGVPATDTAPDNATLTATNVMNFVGSRRSGTSGRRNQLQANDTLYSLNFRGQTTNNSAANGVVGASIIATALDNFTATQYGTKLSISTVNTGTTTSRERLLLTDRLVTLSADQFQFSNGNYTNIPLTFTTSTWNASVDSTVFGNTAGTVQMLSMNLTNNTYNNTNHIFKDRSGLTTALNMTTSTAAFNSGLAITTYNRTYGEFCYTAGTIVATATNTIYAFPLDTTNTANGIVIQSGQQIKFNQVGGGAFKIIMSLQTQMTTNSVGSCDFWLRKNGTDIPNSATQIDLLKDQKAVIAMDWLVTPSVNDYYEIVYAVNDTNLNFPYFAASSSPYVRPAIPPLIVNVIPVGA